MFRKIESTRFAIAALGLLVGLAASDAAAQSWTPPVGIPMPPFGIFEQARPVPSPWTAETPGFYYVDNTHSQASDSFAFGTPGRPRRSIPTGVPAGSVVEVHGGPYVTALNMSGGGDGTGANPIFYRGIGKPQIVNTSPQHNFGLWGSYVILEGFTFVNMQVAIVAHHAAVRDNEMRGMAPMQAGAAVFTNSNNIVIYRNYIHNNGDVNYPSENDINGVFVVKGGNRVWVVDNEMHGNGGDSVHVSNEGSGVPIPKFVYIGRNHMHEEGENAVDIKMGEDIIISQNRAWGLRPTQYATSGSDGSAIVINDDNAANGLNNRIWILFNEISASTVGIRTQNYGYILGNIIHHIQNAAVLSYGPHDLVVEHNTIYSVGRALERFAGYVTNRVFYLNNINAVRTLNDINLTGNATTNSVVSYSLFPSPPRILWGGPTYGTLSSFAAAHGCLGCLEGDPGFANAAGNDFRLTLGSRAKGAATPSALYATFEQLYGLSIAVDINGRARPGADGKWDIGAHESDGVAPPAPPSNVRIIR